MKYIEQTKTIVLTVLVLMSVILTFSIWSYHPNYEKVDKTETIDITMEKKNQISDVVRPSRLLLHRDGKWTGTTSSKDMEPLFKQMQNWELSDISAVSNNFNITKLNDQMLLDNRLILEYPSDVPMPIFENILPMANKKVPEIMFNHLIISWNSGDEDDLHSDELTILFSNVGQKQLYRAKIKIDSEKKYEKQVLDKLSGFAKYTPIQRDNTSTLFVPTAVQNMEQYKYLKSSISIDDFKAALFTNPDIVKVSPDAKTGIDKYSDDRSIMTIDNTAYLQSFVDSTASENQENIQRTNLINNTFGFINQHGGWTGDYRYDGVDYNAQKVDYQLYIENLPIYKTDIGTTKIEAYWGNGRIYRYIRPTYKLAYLPQESNKKVKLISGVDLVERLIKNDKIDFYKITALRTGLTMSQDKGRSSIYLFEPTWFYKLDGKWHAVSKKDAQIGGGKNGLE